MKINSIINRYVFKEMATPFVINLAFFLFVFLMAKILDIVNYIVNYNVGMSDVILMLIYSTPFSLQFVIPISIMIAVLLTLLRMFDDKEIIALKAGGYNIYGMLPPVFLFSLIGCLLTGYMTIYGIPWGRKSFEDLTNKVAADSFEIGLKERTFNDSFKGLMLYVNKINPKDKSLINVFIEDKRTQNIVSTVIAPSGKFFSEKEKLFFRLRLYKGTINQVDHRKRSVNSINFDTYDINLDIKKAFSGERKDSKHRGEMTLAEMRQYLKDDTNKNNTYYRTLMDYHKKLSIPVACLVFGLLAVPLGFQTTTTRRSYGLVLAFIFFILYYLLLTLGWIFGESGAFSPVIGMWLPNVVVGCMVCFLLVRARNERPFMIDYLTDIIKHFISRTSG